MLFGQEHVERYRATGGEEGHDWNGTQTLILTTTGRKSGQRRDTPLIYGRSNGSYLVVASKGGADEPPAWYRNLQADPGAEIQVWGDRMKVRARDASDDEKPELWKEMTSHWSAYDEYQAKTSRRIPVVVLEPA